MRNTFFLSFSFLRTLKFHLSIAVVDASSFIHLFIINLKMVFNRGIGFFHRHCVLEGWGGVQQQQQKSSKINRFLFGDIIQL